jgi:hypothetical protein
VLLQRRLADAGRERCRLQRPHLGDGDDLHALGLPPSEPVGDKLYGRIPFNGYAEGRGPPRSPKHLYLRPRAYAGAETAGSGCGGCAEGLIGGRGRGRR